VGSNEESAVERLVLQPHGGKLERKKERKKIRERKSGKKPSEIKDTHTCTD